MTGVSVVWTEMEAAREFGGSRRIDVDYPQDAFCTLDLLGRRGLLMLSESIPKNVPVFDAMEFTVSAREDGRRSVGITLLSTTLNSAFENLCDGLLAACESVAPLELSEQIVAYLVRANSLLEYGDAQVLRSSVLRGLLGELVLLEWLLGRVPSSIAVNAWVGPLNSPQDFVLPDRLIEVKTKVPTSNKVTISSVEQLDPEGTMRLTLAVVNISSLQDELFDAMTPMELIARIQSLLGNDAKSKQEFDKRLRAANFFPHPYYSKIKFRLNSIRFYEVVNEFPRIRQSSLAKGIVRASYDLDLTACEVFEIAMGDSWNY